MQPPLSCFQRGQVSMCSLYQSQADYGPTLTKYHLQFSRHPRHLFQTSVQFVQQINVKMIHLVCSDGIRTHTRLTRALDQDLRTSQNDSNGREHSSLGEVSLSGWSLVFTSLDSTSSVVTNNNIFSFLV